MAQHSKEWVLLKARYYNAYDRCNNPNTPRYHDYGGRGIQLRFANHIEFCIYVVKYLGLPTRYKKVIDRIDNNGHYEPGNLRWVDNRTSMHNRREIPKRNKMTTTEKRLSAYYKKNRSNTTFKSASEFRQYIINKFGPPQGFFEVRRINNTLPLTPENVRIVTYLPTKHRRLLSVRYHAVLNSNISMSFKDSFEFRDYIVSTFALPDDGKFRIERVDKSRGYEPGNLRMVTTQ